MSDVREQLSNIMASRGFDMTNGDLADAILERFDVTPKPVVTDRKLGMHVVNSYGRMIFGDNPAESVEQRGAALREALAAAGLEIVKVSDAS